MDAEPISVTAAFEKPYQVRPLKFKWSGRVLDIAEITYTWQTTEGRSKIYHFSVTGKGGGMLYELTFNPSTLLWHIQGVAEGT